MTSCNNEVPIAIASRLPPEILLDVFTKVYRCSPEDHQAPESSLFHPPSTQHVSTPIIRSTPSGRVFPLLTVCKVWAKVALTVLYREPIVSLNACGQLAQTLALGGSQQEESLLARPFFFGQGSGASADSSTACIAAPKPSIPSIQRPISWLQHQPHEAERSPYHGMDWFWDPAGGCAQCRQAMRANREQYQHSSTSPSASSPSPSAPAAVHSFPSIATAARGTSPSATYHSSDSCAPSLLPSSSRTTNNTPQSPSPLTAQRPLPINYKQLIKKPCRITGTRHVEKQDLIQLWDLQRVLAYASNTQLEDLPVNNKKKRARIQSPSSSAASTPAPPLASRPAPVLMVLETSAWFRDTTDHVLKNVAGLGIRQLNYHYSQPLQLTNLVREHSQSVQEIHLGQVNLTVDEYIEMAQILGKTQGELKFGYQDRGPTEVHTDHAHDDDDHDNEEDGRDSLSRLRRRPLLSRSASSASKRGRENRTRLRSICFGTSRNAQQRSIIEAFARHCGSGLERVEVQGVSGTRDAAWHTVASLQPYPIPTEFSLHVLGKSTLESSSIGVSSSLKVSSILEKSSLAPLMLVPQEDQDMLRRHHPSEATEATTAQENQADGDESTLEAYMNSLDHEARLGEALVELGQRAPRVTHLRLSCIEGLWDGCLNLFRHPDQVKDSTTTESLAHWQPPSLKCPAPVRGNSSMSLSSLSNSPDMSISPPTSPNLATSPVTPFISTWADASSSPPSGSTSVMPTLPSPLMSPTEHCQDEDMDPTLAYFFARGVHPSRKCGLQELVLTQCGSKSEENPGGSRLTIPGLVNVCGSDLKTLIVDRESCWRAGNASMASPWMDANTAVTGDRIVDGLLAPERQKNARTRMASLKHLLLLDHWVSASSVKRALAAWSFHLRVAQFLVRPCTLEVLLDALSPTCENPSLEVLMLSIVHVSNLTEFWTLDTDAVRVFLSTVFGRFPRLRVVRLNHADATWTRSEWEAFCWHGAVASA